MVMEDVFLCLYSGRIYDMQNKVRAYEQQYLVLGIYLMNMNRHNKTICDMQYAIIFYVNAPFYLYYISVM